MATKHKIILLPCVQILENKYFNQMDTVHQLLDDLINVAALEEWPDRQSHNTVTGYEEMENLPSECVCVSISDGVISEEGASKITSAAGVLL